MAQIGFEGTRRHPILQRACEWQYWMPPSAFKPNESHEKGRVHISTMAKIIFFHAFKYSEIKFSLVKIPFKLFKISSLKSPCNILHESLPLSSIKPPILDFRVKYPYFTVQNIYFIVQNIYILHGKIWEIYFPGNCTNLSEEYLNRVKKKFSIGKTS